MSGDLKDPARSIPRGTLLAVIVSLVVYGLQIVICGGTRQRQNAFFKTVSDRFTTEFRLMSDNDFQIDSGQIDDVWNDECAWCKMTGKRLPCTTNPLNILLNERLNSSWAGPFRHHNFHAPPGIDLDRQTLCPLTVPHRKVRHLARLFKV